MKIVDPGHLYDLDCLDVGLRGEVGGLAERLRFVKRIGEKFPGNRAPGYAGTTTQEVIRALIDRTKYVNGQRENHVNLKVIRDLRSALVELEMRAARERNDALSAWLIAAMDEPETEPTCRGCGHLICKRPECQR